MYFSNSVRFLLVGGEYKTPETWIGVLQDTGNYVNQVDGNICLSIAGMGRGVVV